jgi:hypothetical protein
LALSLRKQCCTVSECPCSRRCHNTRWKWSDDPSHVQCRILLFNCPCRSMPVPCPLRGENVGLDVPCHECNCLDCSNKLQTSVAEVNVSKLLRGENGLFAARHIKQGEWIASFGTHGATSEAGRQGRAGVQHPRDWQQAPRGWLVLHQSAGWAKSLSCMLPVWVATAWINDQLSLQFCRLLHIHYVQSNSMTSHDVTFANSIIHCQLLPK